MYQHSNKCAIDLTQVVGKPFGTCFEVVDRLTGALEEITHPQSLLTRAFFTGGPDDEDGDDQQMED